MIRALANDIGQKWDQILRQAVFALSTKVSSATSYSPFQLMFGRDQTTPLHLLYDTGEEQVMPGTSTRKHIISISNRSSSSSSSRLL